MGKMVGGWGEWSGSGGAEGLLDCLSRSFLETHFLSLGGLKQSWKQTSLPLLDYLDTYYFECLICICFVFLYLNLFSTTEHVSHGKVL